MKLLSGAQPRPVLAAVVRECARRAIEVEQDRNQDDGGQQHEVRAEEPEHERHRDVVGTHADRVELAGAVQMQRHVLGCEGMMPGRHRHVDYVADVMKEANGLCETEERHEHVEQQRDQFGEPQFGVGRAENALAGAAALTARIAIPNFVQSIGAKEERAKGWLPLTLGLLMTALFVLAAFTALGFTFDSRYRDFPFAPLTAAAVPLLFVAILVPRPDGTNWPLAETAGAALLVACGGFIVWNETAENWQALWTVGALALVAVTLLRVRAAPDSK